ncbi:MAG TPA: methyltransferase domain-containing protein [Planctomycetota bacterium]|nr:methyltransferase domain-containing protein [Planctomycetota bacterium]
MRHAVGSVLLLLSAAALFAGENEPPALTEYKGRKIAQTMHFEGAPWLVRESREREEECSKLIKALNVKPGQLICDLGSGNGFYTLKLAPLVGKEGKLLAVEIQKEMLDMLQKRAAVAEITNVECILGTLWDPKLPEGKLDMVLMVDVYHELSHPEHILAAVRKSLKPDGRMVLVEFRMEDPKVPIKLLHKMSKAQIMKEIPPNGFKLVEEYDELPWQHVMFFQRDDSKPAGGETPSK